MRIKYEQPSVCHQSYKSVLGQRPIWDWRHDKLLWVDIYENKIIETDQDNNEDVNIQYKTVSPIFFYKIIKIIS